MTPDEAVERVKAYLRSREQLDQITEYSATALRHLLSRYERMEKALERIAEPGDAEVNRALLYEGCCEIARQALGASE